jgi:murein DD-endopeptidase MepM/ murein hydrolase activator NlpD
MNFVNYMNKNLMQKMNKNLQKMDKNLLKKILIVLFIGVGLLLNIDNINNENNMYKTTAVESPGTHTVMKYDSRNRVTGKFIYNNKGYLYESRIYNPDTKKLKALRYFYRDTGRINSARIFNSQGKVTRLNTWYNVKSRKEQVGKKAHSIIYDCKHKKIAKEIAYAPNGKVKPVGRFIEPIKNGKRSVSSGFGGARQHTGLDLAYNSGGSTFNKPIYASNSGRVVEVDKTSNVGYGHHVIIDHGNGIRTLYGHMNKVNVHEGQIVWKNEKIGTIGSTGNSTGPHVHFEYRKKINQFLNPIKYIRRAVYYTR